MTAAHNTVVVDGKNQTTGSGTVTLWHDEGPVQVVKASAPKLIGGQQYKRTVALVDINERNFYVIDIFLVVGGTKHDKFVHSHFGRVIVNAATQPVELPSEYAGTQMRNFALVARENQNSPLQLDWLIEDRYGYLLKGKQVRLRYFDLTERAQVFLCEGWVAMGIGTTEDAWIERLMVRREGQMPLASTFVAILVPFEGNNAPVKEVRRLPLQAPDGSLYGDENVALEIVHPDGSKDLLIAMDTENPLKRQPDLLVKQEAYQPEWKVRTKAPFCFVRRSANGRILVLVQIQ